MAEKCISPIDERKCVYDLRMSEFYHSFLSSNTRANATEDIKINCSVSRPKCSISPININEHIAHAQDSSYLSVSGNLPSFYSYPHTHLSILNPSDSGYQSVNESSVTNLPSISAFVSHNTSTHFALSPCVNSRAMAPLTNKHLLIEKPFNRFEQSTPTKPLDELLPEALPVKTVCEPAKKKVNFHSIHELAKSSCASSNANRESKWNLSDIPQVTLNNNSSTDNSSNENSSASSSSVGLSFNEQLRVLSQSILNKENILEEDSNLKVFFYYIVLAVCMLKRKQRTQISKQQREILEYAFSVKSYPDSNEIEYLCNLLGFEESVIRIWFQNKRARQKTSKPSRR